MIFQVLQAKSQAWHKGRTKYSTFTGTVVAFYIVMVASRAQDIKKLIMRFTSLRKYLNVLGLVFCPFLISFLAFSRTSSPNLVEHPNPEDCGKKLLAHVNTDSGHRLRLGIGALVVDDQGIQPLGVGPYSGIDHQYLFDFMAANLIITKILWLGELRYIKIDDSILIIDANKTSGVYANHLKNKKNELPTSLTQDGNSIIVENDVNQVPLSLRAIEFVAIPYDPKNKRIEPLLNELKNLRHDVQQSIISVMGLFRVLGSAERSAEEKKALLQYVEKTHFKTLRWLIDYMLEEKLIKSKDILQFSALIGRLMSSDFKIEEIHQYQLADLNKQGIAISRISKGEGSDKHITIYKIPKSAANDGE
jgi:hypothetical protein